MQADMSLRVLFMLVLVGTALSYRHYQNEVPNGDVVPHPCKPNYFWRGLGHKNPLGGGPRNPFGSDFSKYHQWTQELCRMDSDGDGKSNGEELGDPNCVWTKGALPEQTSGITHPGICDPWGSPQCQEANKDVSCETGEFNCEGINDPDVFNLTFRFPLTHVPARETSYMCFTFELDMLDPNTDYHLIATEPYMDNPNVMHHTTVTGCNAISVQLAEPELCNMASPNCQSSLAVWTLGLPGECIYKEAGFKIGPKAGMTRINMQHHWTNPELKNDYYDSSGMVLYLTKKLRPNNAAYFTTGETKLVIPPGMDRVVKTSTCSSGCTRRLLTSPIQLMTGLNHMHNLGYQGNVEHFRDGMKLRDLTPDEHYSYDNPIIHMYDPPIEMRPGDSLETTCVFRSTYRSTTTLFGEGTSDEMCYSIFTYYPAENFKVESCVTWGELELCDYNSEEASIFGCQLNTLFNQTNPTRNYLFSKILDNCNFYGECRVECPAAIAEVKQHPCFSDKLADYMTDVLRILGSNTLDIPKFLAAFESCNCPLSPQDPNKWVYPSGAVFYQASLFLIVFAAIFRMVL